MTATADPLRAGPSHLEEPARLAWFDVSAGVAGDMLCGALVDAGAPLEVLQDAVDAVVPGAVRWSHQRVRRAGLRAAAVTPELVGRDDTGRPWPAIRDLLAGSDLPAPVCTAASTVLGRIAEVEARLHDTAVDDVHLHEVGGLDAIADVVGTCAALHHLGITEVVGSRLAVGSGEVRAAHGLLPVPVPAVVALAHGWTVTSGGDGELATPTGTALVTTLASRCGPLPALRLEAAGTGAGRRDTPSRANVVRVLVGRPAAAADGEGTVGTQHLLATNVDDLDPRLWPQVLDALLAAGAADAWLTPIVMKKGRPAHTLTVLAPPEAVATLRRVLAESTSTIGLREQVIAKHALPRVHTSVEVAGMPIAVKVAVAGGRVVHATPEYAEVVAVAARLDRPVRQVLEAASAAVVQAGLVAGAVPPSST